MTEKRFGIGVRTVGLSKSYAYRMHLQINTLRYIPYNAEVLHNIDLGRKIHQPSPAGHANSFQQN